MASLPAGELLVHVRVLARGSRSEIQGVKEGRLLIKTTYPPVDGAANRDVIRQLSEAFGVPPSRVLLHRGKSDRLKTFRVREPKRVPAVMAELLRHNET